MLRPDDLAPPLPGYTRVIVCSPAAAAAVQARVDELGDVAVTVLARAHLAGGEGYTWQRPLEGAP